MRQLRKIRGIEKIMKQLRLSTLSLCCLTAIMSPSVFAEEIKPLLQEGKTTLLSTRVKYTKL